MKNDSPLIIILSSYDAQSYTKLKDEFVALRYETVIVSTFGEFLAAVHEDETRKVVMFTGQSFGGFFGGFVAVLNYVQTLLSHRVAAYVWAANPQFEMERIALDNGAYDVFDKNIVKVKKLVLHIKRAQKHLAALEESYEDHLTGLQGPKAFYKTATAKLKTARDRGNTEIFSVILLDGDKFGQINKTYGHLVGNLAIQATAEVIKKNVRSTDDSCRFGGDEYAILLSGSDHRGATVRAEKIRKQVAACSIGEEQFAISVSFGVAELRRSDIGEEPLKSLKIAIELADKMLREDKKRLPKQLPKQIVA